MTGLVRFGPEELAAVLPAIVLAATGCLLILLDAFAPRMRSWFPPLSLTGIAGSLYFLLRAPLVAPF